MRETVLILLMAIATTYSQSSSYCNLSPTNSWTMHSTGSPTVFIRAPTCYKPGERVQVILFSDITIPFTEFIIKAHTSQDATPVGNWEAQSPLEAIDCLGGLKNVLVMKSSLNLQKTFINISWIAPVNYYNTVIFNATFTDNGGKVWKNVTSLPVKFNATCGKVDVKPAQEDVCGLLPSSMIKMGDSKRNYGITLSQTCFKVPDVIKVDLFSDISTPFYGFAIQAHMQEPRKMLYGRFIKQENNMIMHKECYGMKESTLYMRRSSSSMVLMQTEWTPDESVVGDAVIMFNATVIDENGYSVVNITSLPLRYKYDCGVQVVPSARPPISGAQNVMMSLFSTVLMLMFVLINM